MYKKKLIEAVSGKIFDFLKLNNYSKLNIQNELKIFATYIYTNMLKQLILEFRDIMHNDKDFRSNFIFKLSFVLCYLKFSFECGL